MRLPLNEVCDEIEDSFYGSQTNRSPITDTSLIDNIAGHFTESGSTVLDNNHDPPHFSIASTRTPTLKRRTPGAVAMFKRRLMRGRKEVQVATSFGTQSGTDSAAQMEITDVTGATGTANPPIDSEFGTGFLRVESQAGSEDEGCVEQAEAVLTVSGLTPIETHGTSLLDNTASSETTVSGRTTTAGSTFKRFKTRARRVLRPLANVPIGNRGASDARVGSIIEPPPGVVVKQLKIDGELCVVFTREPSASELREDLEIMKQRFPAVPKFEGNPPWLTKFHPDLVRPPARSQTHA